MTNIGIVQFIGHQLELVKVKAEAEAKTEAKKEKIPRRSVNQILAN